MKRAFSAIFKSSILVFFGLSVKYLLGFASQVAISRYLGPEDFGSIAASLTLVLFITSLLRMGLDNGIARFIPRYDDTADRSKVIWTGIIIGMPLSAIVSVVLFGASQTIATTFLQDEAAAKTIAVFSFLVIPFIIVQLSVAAARGMNQTIPKILMDDVLYPASKLCGFLTLIYIGGSMVDFSYVYVAGYLLSSIVGIYYLSKYLNRIEIDTAISKKVLTFSIPIALSGVTYKILTDIDTILLSYYSTTSGPVGIYNVVYPLASLLLIIPQSTGYLAMPTLSKLDSNEEKQEFQQIYRLIVKWTAIVAIPVVSVFILFSEPIIAVIYGMEYTAGSLTLVILTLGFFTHIITGPNGDSLEALGYSQFLFLSGVLVAVLNIFLNVLLIPSYSTEGAAVATSLSYAFRNILIGTQIYRKSGILSIPRNITAVVSYSGICLGVLFWFSRHVVRLSDTVVTIPVLFAVTLGYLFTVGKTAIGSYERELVQQALEKYNLDIPAIGQWLSNRDE
ncbi:flippase [Haloarcula sp. 1CSR25-25]|uniref:flippase n=1 Tax=Haloarcula sp. 1CSR25-25 TaxID=2862545 RepID=UPI002895EDAF|nr:flippase [Haloarcula sp. 1CSR25-25]MDT3434233.1 flippase [Haloarcula sp. 1CSR25-25]